MLGGPRRTFSVFEVLLELALDVAEGLGLEVLEPDDLLGAEVEVLLEVDEDLLHEEREAALLELDDLLVPVEVVEDVVVVLEDDGDVAAEPQEVAQVGAAALVEELRVPDRAEGNRVRAAREVGDFVLLGDWSGLPSRRAERSFDTKVEPSARVWFEPPLPKAALGEKLTFTKFLRTTWLDTGSKPRLSIFSQRASPMKRDFRYEMATTMSRTCRRRL